MRTDNFDPRTGFASLERDVNPILITIIMPVFNAELYLRDAVNSVLAQDHEHWELIIIDDGSTDESLCIAGTFHDRRIKIIKQANGGVARARNAGLRVMQGDFFCFLDADDSLPPNSLSARLQCFESPEVCFADGTVEIYNSDLTTKLRVWHPQHTQQVFKSLVRLDNKCFFGPTWMVRRIPGIDYHFPEGVSHGEDLYFCLSYCHLGGYTFTTQVVLKYRKSNFSAMSNLKGLANGYKFIGKKLRDLPAACQIDRVIFSLKSRKAMFLDFIKASEFKLAFEYLVFGSI